MEDNPLVAVDFDKTLTEPDGDEWAEAHTQPPNEDMIEKVREAHNNGGRIIIWTARKWWEASKIAGWLAIHEVPYHGLRCNKGGADLYIDDKTESPEEFIGEETIMRVSSVEME